MIIKEEQAKKIAELLKLFYEKNNLNERYTAKVPELPDFLECLDKEINKQITSYEKNIVLKEELHKKIKEKKSVIDEKNIKDIVLWIIRKWGGICSVNENAENSVVNVAINDVKRFFNYEDYEEITFDNIFIKSPIPSRSKVLSFLYPETCVICDSRVVFTLNRLLEITSDNKNTIYIKPLPSRNTILNDAIKNMNERIKKQGNITLINLYSDFCESIKLITTYLNKKDPNKKDLNEKEWKLYETEMLLFTLANDKNNGIDINWLWRELGEKIKFKQAKTILKKNRPKINIDNQHHPSNGWFAPCHKFCVNDRG